MHVNIIRRENGTSTFSKSCQHGALWKVREGSSQLYCIQSIERAGRDQQRCGLQNSVNYLNNSERTEPAAVRPSQENIWECSRFIHWYRVPLMLSYLFCKLNLFVFIYILQSGNFRVAKDVITVVFCPRIFLPLKNDSEPSPSPPCLLCPVARQAHHMK